MQREKHIKVPEHVNMGTKRNKIYYGKVKKKSPQSQQMLNKRRIKNKKNKNCRISYNNI